MNVVNKPIVDETEVANHIVTRIEAFDRTSKVIYRTISLAKLIAPIPVAISNLGIVLNKACDSYEATRFFGLMAFLAPKKNGKYFYFFFDPKNSWQKCADRLCLVAHTILKLMNAAYKCKFTKLAGITAVKLVGHLTIFKFVMDGFVVVSSMFGLWDTALALRKEGKEQQESKDKIAKWDQRRIQVTNLLKLDSGVQSQDFIDETKLLFSQKINEQSNRLATDKQGLIAAQTALNSESVNELPKEKKETTVADLKAKITKFSASIERAEAFKVKYKNRLEQIETKAYRNLAVEMAGKEVSLESDDRTIVDSINEKADLKNKKWSAVRDLLDASKVNHWMKVATCIGKIAVITLALTLTAINVWSPFVLVPLIGLGILADSTALTKIIYENFYLNELKKRTTEFVKSFCNKRPEAA